MAEIAESFRQRAEELIASINRSGGVRATIEALRKQMAEADRRRAMAKVQDEIKRMHQQTNEMVQAVGLQAIGLYEKGRLESPELQPLCQHVAELKAAVTDLEKELASLEAQAAAEEAAQRAATEQAVARQPVAQQASEEVGPRARPIGTCPTCGRHITEEGAFCPYCGSALDDYAEKRFCIKCGSELRPGAKFCSKCGRNVKPQV